MQETLKKKSGNMIKDVQLEELTQSNNNTVTYVNGDARHSLPYPLHPLSV